MNKYLITGLLFLLFSCASQKKTESHFTSSGSSRETNELTSNQSSQSVTISSTEKNETEETQTHIIRYDTSLPPDSITGKPPVKEEEFRTTGRKLKETVESETLHNEDVSQTGKQTSDDQSEATGDEKTDTETEVAGGKSFVWVWIVVIAAIGCFIFFPMKK
jgi:hypothetical protein